MSETEPCPRCGSREVLPKAESPFQYDGLICIACGHTWPGPWPERPRIIIKSWRKAWWEK